MNAPQIPVTDRANSPVNAQAAATCEPAMSPLLNLSNGDFITAVFKHLPASATPVVCIKKGDPTQGGWLPQPAMANTDKLRPEHNNYVNCASFRPDPAGQCSAKSELLAAYHFILLDDVGTKVPREALGSLVPTWSIETSPGNFQMGIVLGAPIKSMPFAKCLQSAIAAKQLSDPGANGVNRWARLPVGINGKEKYRDSLGKPFQCRLTEYNPGQTYTVAQLVEVLALDMSPENLSATSSMTSSANERLKPILRVDELRGLLDQLDPDMDRPDWIRVLMAVWHETQASEEGFDLVDHWSRPGKTYGGTNDMRAQWRSFGATDNPVTVGTLIHMVQHSGGHVGKVRGDDASGVTVAGQSMDVLDAERETDALITSLPKSLSKTNPLLRFAVTNDLASLARNVVE